MLFTSGVVLAKSLAVKESNVIARFLSYQGRTAVMGAACIFFLGVYAGTGLGFARADQGKIPHPISEMPVTRIIPPEQNFFGKRLDYLGLPIKGHPAVADEAFYQAWRLIDGLLRNNPQILSNLLAGGSEVHITGRNHAQTERPDFRKSHAAPPGKHLENSTEPAGNILCQEENLLGLSADEERPRNDFWREFTGAIYARGIGPQAREQVEKTFQSSMEAGRWQGAGASSSAREYLAAITLWYVEGQGDLPRDFAPAQPGQEWLKTYDPAGYQMVDDLFQGRWDAQHSLNSHDVPGEDSFPPMTPGGNGGDAPPAHHVHAAMPSRQGNSVTVKPGEVLELKSSGVELTYDITEIRARAGDKLTIRYDNTMSDMAHNIVVVKAEKDIMAVGIAALQAHRNEYIPQDKKDRIIAFSKLAYPGDTVEFSFMVPPPGTYPYICTYSGHFTMMQGRLISIKPEAEDQTRP
jgi:azurin